MRGVAVVPARAGSKGIVGKNMRWVLGKPLVLWSIEQAIASPSIGAVLVSSDDPRVLALCEGLPKVVKISRPPELATDNAKTDDAIAHALSSWHDGQGDPAEFVVLLQPTSPCRDAGLIERAIDRVWSQRANSGFTAYPGHFVWTMGDGGSLKCNARRVRRQDFTPAEVPWIEDGSVYVTRTDAFRATGNRLARWTCVIPNDPYPDVDTERDLARVEFELRALRAAGRLA